MTPPRTRVIGISIGIVSERTGLHPQTLREYERQGLIAPARTQGGARRYRDIEIARLQRIQQLSALGMSLAAVRYALELEDRISAMSNHIAQLEAQVAEAVPSPSASSMREHHTTGSLGAPAPGTGLIRRSMSVEIVHVPRPARGPRWRNSG
jgi:MerR family transcriptional regulator/heat shock protein HspR